jgi:drug/metabolite transporter (DMT)-like permease
LWSASLLTISDALDQVDPLTAACLRLPFFALVLIVIAAVRGDFQRQTATRSDMGVLALSGCFVLSSMTLFLLSADLAPAGTVAVLTSTAPIFAVPMAALLLGEKVTARVLAGVAACTAGILLASTA